MRKFLTDAKCHPKIPKPIKETIALSRIGFDSRVLKRQFEIESTEGIKVKLLTPEDMLHQD